MELKAIPKVEHHVHIEAIVSQSTLKELINKYKLSYFHMESFQRSVRKGYTDITKLFENWHFLNSLLKKPEDFELITFEYLKEVSEFNTKYVELNINVMRQIQKGLDISKVLEAIYSAQVQAQEEFAITSRTILSYSRDFDIEDGKMIVDMANRFRNFNVVGIDIAGNEKAKPNGQFIEVFEYARQKNVNRVAHAGEGASQNSVRDAVQKMKVKRIGHGVDAAKDDQLLKLIKQNDVCVELCVTSNKEIGIVDSLENHPGRIFLDRGIDVTLNTDDPSLFGVSLLDEYERVADAWNLSRKDLLRIYQNGIKHALCEQEVKEQLLNFIF